jgi:hypothetical protein
MKWIGHGSLRRKEVDVFLIGAFIMSGRGRYTGGYGAEAYRLMCRFAADALGASRVVASNTDLERKAALEEAGFRLVGAWPPQHAKRRRGYGVRRYEWLP